MKRFHPVTISDPSYDGHLAVVHPTQGAIVTLTDPPGKEWHHQLCSEFFYIEEVERRGGKFIVSLGQLFDMTAWSEQSIVHLGSLNFYVDDSDKACSVDFVLYKTGRPLSVRTVINPQGQKIRMNSDDLLEVVCFDRTDKDIELDFWSAIRSNSAAPWLEMVRRETVFVDAIRGQGEGKFVVMRRDCDHLPVNERLPAEISPIELKGKVFRQYHFWFRAKQSVLAATGQLWPVPTILGFNNGLAASRQLRVAVCARGWEEVDSDQSIIRATGRQQGLSLRLLDEAAGIIQNPKIEEAIDIMPSATAETGFLVEIGPPDALIKGSLSSRWDMHIESVAAPVERDGPCIQRMSAQEIENRDINGRRMQRFMVQSHVKEIPVGSMAIYLGAIILEPDFGSIKQASRRTLKFWLSKKACHHRDQESPTIAVTTVSCDFRRKPKFGTGKFVLRVSIEAVSDALDDGAGWCVFQSIIVVGGKKKRKLATTTSRECWSVANGVRSVDEGVLSSPAAVSEWLSTKTGRLVVINDPKDGCGILLSPHQYASFRLPLASMPTADDVWFSNSIQLDQQNFWLDGARQMVVDGKRWQVVELRLVPCEKKRLVGRHFLGGVRFHNANSYLSVPIILVVEKCSEAMLLPAYRMERARLERLYSESFRLTPGSSASKPRTVELIEPEDGCEIVLAHHESLAIKVSKRTLEVTYNSTVYDRWIVRSWPSWLTCSVRTDVGMIQTFIFAPTFSMLTAANGDIILEAGAAKMVVKVKVGEGVAR